MEFIFAQIISLLAVTQPGKLQQMRSFAVRQIYQNKAAVLSLLTVILLQAQGLLIKLQAFSKSNTLKLLCAKVNSIMYTSRQIIYLKEHYLLQKQRGQGNTCRQLADNRKKRIFAAVHASCTAAAETPVRASS